MLPRLRTRLRHSRPHPRPSPLRQAASCEADGCMWFGDTDIGYAANGQVCALPDGHDCHNKQSNNGECESFGCVFASDSGGGPC